MSLSIYNIQHDSYPKIRQSYFGLNQTVLLGIYKNAFYDKYKYLVEVLPDTYSILNTEPITYGFSHSWQDGPGGKVVDKLNEYLGSDIVKLLSSRTKSNGGSYVSNTAADAYSQKILEETSPLSLSLKTKCFHPNFNKNKDFKDQTNKNANYKDFIKFLALVTAPIEFNFLNYWTNIKNLFDKKTNKGAATVKTQGNAQSSMGSKIIGQIANLVDNLATDFGLTNYTFGKHLRGNFSLVVKTDTMCGPQTSEIDWIVKSWKFKPSTQFLYTENGPEPLWIDFTLDLETNMALSNMQIYNLFIN